MQSQIQVPSQLNPDVWDEYLMDYWDKQLGFLIRYGFPLDFKEGSPLQHELKNHSSANLYTEDIKALISVRKIAVYNKMRQVFQIFPEQNAGITEK